MSYAAKGEQVFAYQDPTYPDCTPSTSKRSDHRLKNFQSTIDRRAWDYCEEIRYRHLYDLMTGSRTCLGIDHCHRYVPLEDLIRILMAEKDELINQLQQGGGDKDMLEAQVKGLTGEVNKSREMLRQAMHKLENIDEIVNENKKLQCRLRCSEERVRYLEDKKKKLESELADLRSKSQIQMDLDKAQKMLSKVTQRREMSTGMDEEEMQCLTQERNQLQDKVRELEKELKEAKKREAEIESLRKQSHSDSLDREEISRENECFRKKLASMKCLEKQIQELKKQGRALADKYKRDSQKAAEQMKKMCQAAKELQCIREERDSLRKRVNELASYECQYNKLQRKLQRVDVVIAENDCLNSKLVALQKLEKENEYLKSRLDGIQEVEVSAAEDKEKIMQLQCAVEDQEEEIKDLLCQIERLTSGKHEEELERLRCELHEKDCKLKLCEEQLAEVPMLEAEIDELRTKLQTCCREFPEKKRGESSYQKAEVRLPASTTGIRANYKCPGQTSSSVIGVRREEKVELRDKAGSCHEIKLDAGKMQKGSFRCRDKKEMSCEEVQNLLQSSKGIISCVLEDMMEHQKEMEELEKCNRAMKEEIEMLKAKVGSSDKDCLLEEINSLKKALEGKNAEISKLQQQAGASRDSSDDIEELKELNAQMKAELQAACGGLKQVAELKRKLEEEHKARCEAEGRLQRRGNGAEGRLQRGETGAEGRLQRGENGAEGSLQGGENGEEQQAIPGEWSQAIPGETVKKMRSEDPESDSDGCRSLQKEIGDLKLQIAALNALTDELKKENELLRELQKPCPDFSKELDEKCALENLLSLLQAELDAFKGQKLSNECEALRNELKRVMEQNCQLKALLDCYRQRLELEKQSTDLVQGKRPEQKFPIVTPSGRLVGSPSELKRWEEEKAKEAEGKAMKDQDEEAATKKAEAEAVKDQEEEAAWKEAEAEAVKDQEEEAAWKDAEAKVVKDQEEEAVWKDAEAKAVKEPEEEAPKKEAEAKVMKDQPEEAAGKEAEAKAMKDLQEEAPKKEAEAKAMKDQPEEAPKKEVEAKPMKDQPEEAPKKEVEAKAMKDQPEEAPKKEAEAKPMTDQQDEAARKEAEAKALKDQQDEAARKEAEAKALKDQQDEAARKEAEAKALKDQQDEAARKEAEAKALKDQQDEAARKEAEAKALKDQQDEAARKEAEAKALKDQQDEAARKEAEAKALKDQQDEAARKEAEAKALKAQQEEAAKKEAEAKALKDQQDEAARKEAEAKALKAQQEEAARKEAEAKALKDQQDEAARKEAEAKALKAQQEEAAKKEAEAKALKAQQDEAAKKEAEAKAAKDQLQEAAMKEKMNQCEDELKALKNNLAQMQQENEKLKTSLKESEKKLEAASSQKPESGPSPDTTGLQDRLKQLEAENEEKLRKLMQQHEKELADRDKKYNDNLNAMKTGYETDIRKLTERHKASVMRLQGLHEDQVQEMNTNYETQLETMQTQSEEAMKDLAKGSAAKLRKLAEKHAKEMKDVENKLGEARGSLSQSKEELKKAKAEADGKATQLMARHSRDMQKLRRASSKKLDALKDALEDEKKKAQAEIDALRQKMKAMEASGGVCDCKKKKIRCPRPRDPTCSLDFDEVLEKILELGMDSLTFNEIALVHRKACCALEGIMMNSRVCPKLEPPIGDGCPHDPLLEADKKQLLSRIFALENDIAEKQKQTQEAIISMEVAIKKERCRLQELKNSLQSEQRKNSELKLMLSSQSKLELDLKKENEKLENMASLHRSLSEQKSRQLDDEIRGKKSLEAEVEKLKAKLKQLHAALNNERGGLDCKQTNQLEVMRVKLEQALNQERRLELQLENEAKYRMHLQCHLQALRQSYKQMVNLPAVEQGGNPLEMKVRPPHSSVARSGTVLLTKAEGTQEPAKSGRAMKSAKERQNLDQMKEKKCKIKAKSLKKHRK